jgi:ribonuclease D
MCGIGPFLATVVSSCQSESLSQQLVTGTADRGTAMYLDTTEAVTRHLESIRGTRELALDTEGASFHRFVDRIYLLQLSTRTSHAIIDPLPIGNPPILGQLLEDPAVEVVFHDADYDLRLLHQDYGWRATHIFDTRIAAQLLGLKAFGLAALLERYFDVRLDKKHQRADWSMRPLSQDMLDYAALDTLHLLALKDRMREDLKKAGRLSWAEEEFKRLEGTRWEEEDPNLAFLRMKGARDLDRRQLAILRELYAWRNQVASQLDRATFRVASNEMLIAVAQGAPTSVSDLAQIKAVPPPIRQRHATELLEGVKRGLAVPEAELPRFPRAQRWDRDADFDNRVNRLKTVRDAAAQRLDLDPGVFCSRERLEAIARLEPKTLDELQQVEGLRRWQIAEIGEPMIGALRTSKGSGSAADSPYSD